MNKTSITTKSSQVQSGIIDIFKQYNLHQNNSKSYKRKGEIHHKLDLDIGKKILSIEGNISASNYIEVPNPETQKSINCSGKFYYVHLSSEEDKKFSFQIIFTLNSIPVKFNFKYPLSSMKFTQTNAYVIDIPLDFNSKLSLNYYELIKNNNTNMLKYNEKCFNSWNIVKFNPSNFINEYLLDEFKSFGKITQDNLILKSFTAYSHMKIKGFYISNQDYKSNSLLPKELLINKLDKNQNTISSFIFDINFIFKINNASEEELETLNNQIDESINESNAVLNKNQTKIEDNKDNLLTNYDEDITNLEKKITAAVKDSENSFYNTKDNMSKLSGNNIKNRNDSTINKSNRKGNVSTTNDYELKEYNSEVLKKHMIEANEEALDRRIALKKALKKREDKKVALLPDPIMSLKFILGFSSNNCYNLKYCSSNNKNSLLFPSGSMMINFTYEGTNELQNLKQKFFLGHSNPITCYAVTKDFSYMFTAQEGKNSIIRVWNIENKRCVSMFTTPYSKITTMSIRRDSQVLATVGLEGYNKELIILWDISNKDKINVLIKQASHFNILDLKFSPYEDKLTSCGKENIKFWSVRNDHLGGKAVVLNEYARNSYFKCIDFDNPFLGDNITKGRAFVGSNNGCILEVNCDTMELDAVYKIHDSCITSIAVNDAFCVTGTQDGFLRVWLIDFSEYLIEAKHDSPVMSIDISYDALEIICGTKNGSIGSLNIQTKNYTTLLRSPPGKILYMTCHPNGNYIFTIEENNSVRVWDVDNKSESFHFTSPNDAPSTICAPKHDLYLSCGFSSGTLKVFDLTNASIIYECRPFNNLITEINFLHNGSILVCMSNTGNISLHDTSCEFIQIKVIKIESPTQNPFMTVSKEEDFFSTIGPDSNNVLVWNTTTYGIKNRIPLKNSLAKTLSFITNKLLGIVLENGNINIYSLVSYEGILCKEFSNLHIDSINTLNISKNLKYLITGGKEGIIKVLCAKMLYKNYTSFQQYIGHSKGLVSIAIIEHKSLLVSVSEDDGIFFWNFHGDLTFTETEVLEELENMSMYNPNTNKKYKCNVEGTTKNSDFREKHLFNTYNNEQNSNFEKDIDDINIRNEIKNNINLKSLKEVDKFTMMQVEKDDESCNFNYTKGSFKPDLSEYLNDNSTYLKNNNISYSELEKKLYFKPKFNPEKLNIENNNNIDTSNKMFKKYVLGMCVNSRSNLIYNPYKRYIVYSVNNKVIVEFLEECRSQIILEDSLDEISSLYISTNWKYLAASTGYVNKEKNSPIFIWETDNWTLSKRLNFHFKGIQCLCFSNCNQYLISVGNIEEKSICIWNLNNYTVIDSKSLKFPIHTIKPERLLLINNQLSLKGNLNTTNINKGKLLHFVTASLEVVSFWRLDSATNINSHHLKIEDITRSKSELITAMELSPYFEAVKTSFVLIGTNLGGCLVVDKEKKVLIRKFIISQAPVYGIYFNLERMILTTDSPLLYSWKIVNSKNNDDFNNYTIVNENKVFDFLNDTKNNCDIMFLDNEIRSCSFSIDGNEGLIGTENGGIYYANLKEITNIKILNSHVNEEINMLKNIDNTQLITTSNDGTIRSWTLDSYDQRFEFNYYNKNETCHYIEFNTKENIAVVLFKYKELSNNSITENSDYVNINSNIESKLNASMIENNINNNILFKENNINQLNTTKIKTFLRVYNIDKLQSLGKINIPGSFYNINNFKLIFNGYGIIATTYQDKVFVFDIQNWNPLTLLFTETISDYIPKNQLFRHIDSLDLDENNSLCAMSFSNGSVVIIKIFKLKGSVECDIIDNYNIFEYHMSKSDDINTIELFKNLTEFRTNFLSNSIFSMCWPNIIYTFHESLQFLFVRNYEVKEVIRRIPLNYFPLCMNISQNDKYMTIGTKEGVVLSITRIEDSINSGYNLDTYIGHYSEVRSIAFTNKKNLVSSSHSEIIVWETNK